MIPSLPLGVAKLQTFESPLKQTNNRLIEISGLRVPADASTLTWQVMVRQLGLLRVEKVTALHFSNPTTLNLFQILFSLGRAFELRLLEELGFQSPTLAAYLLL